MRAALMSMLLAAAFQDPPAKAGEEPERLFLLDRSILRAEITGYEAAGRIRLKDRESGRAFDVAIEEVSRVKFGAEGPVAPAPGDQARLYYGGTFTGKVASFNGTVAVLETAAATLRVHRGDVKAFTLGATTLPLPEIKDVPRDVLIREVEKAEEGREKPVRQLVAEYGRLLSIGDKVSFRVAPPAREGEAAAPPEETREFDRASVKHVYLHRDEPPPELPPGWYAKLTLRNGDRLVGILQAVNRDKVRLFSHVFGTAEIEKKRIHTLTFVQHARLAVGNVLVCDQTGVHEFDRQGRPVWDYAQNTQYAWIARKLANGNVLLANTNHNQVLEVKPTGRTGGEIVGRIDGTQYPYDALRLDNGNTVVAEYYSNRVVEYDGQTRAIVWQVAVSYPMSIQRLDNGNTLISTNAQVIEVAKDGSERWRAALGDVRPWKAQRLENGNTLIADFQRGQVVEIDPQSAVVWRHTGLSRPVQAIRLEDGNTLIVEQGNNRVIEVDPSNPKKFVEVIRGINYPQGMSIY